MKTRDAVIIYGRPKIGSSTIALQVGQNCHDPNLYSHIGQATNILLDRGSYGNINQTYIEYSNNRLKILEIELELYRALSVDELMILLIQLKYLIIIAVHHILKWINIKIIKNYYNINYHIKMFPMQFYIEKN